MLAWLMILHSIPQRMQSIFGLKMPLSSLLIKPIQRITKYPLLLKVYNTRNTHEQWVLCQVYASPTRPVQLCVHMSINDIPDCDGHVGTYIVHHEKWIPHSEPRASAFGNYAEMGVQYI